MTVGAYLPAPAAAGDPPGNPAVSIYTEQVPTSIGSKPVVSSRGTHRNASKAVRARIAKQGGADAALLRQVVEGAESGAPQQTFPHTRAVASAQKPQSAASGGPQPPTIGEPTGSRDFVFPVTALALATLIVGGGAAALKRGR